MSALALLLAAFSGLSAFVVIAILWFLDIFERESWGNLLLALLSGSAFYGIALFLYSKSSIGLSVAGGSLGLKTVILASFFAGALLIIAQIMACLSLYALRKKYFDTMTDYVLYMCSVGVGFDLAERLVTQYLNLNTIQPISNQVYFTSFGFGYYYPFLFSLYGCALFVIVNARRLSSYHPRATAFIVLAMAVGAQFLFGAGTLLPNLTSAHTYSILSIVSESILSILLNISYLSIAGLIGLCVLMDSHIIGRFTDGLQAREEFHPFAPWFSYLRHPWYQMCSSHSLLWAFSGAKKNIELPGHILNSYSRLALKSWLRPDRRDEYIKLTRDLLSEHQSKVA